MATVTFSPSSSSSSSFLRPATVTLFFVTAATAEDL